MTRTRCAPPGYACWHALQQYDVGGNDALVNGVYITLVYQ